VTPDGKGFTIGSVGGTKPPGTVTLGYPAFAGVAAKLFPQHFNAAATTPQSVGDMGWILDLTTAIDLALERAAVHGTATVVIRRSHHIACLAAYLARVTARGMVVVLQSSDPSVASVAPFGGVRLQKIFLRRKELVVGEKSGAAEATNRISTSAPSSAWNSAVPQAQVASAGRSPAPRST